MDNPLTEAGVQLGRMLIHEKKLSGDNTQACADCHLQSRNFSDPAVFSVGIAGQEGPRHSMVLSNLAWHVHHGESHGHGFFWDGRAASLRDQDHKPIKDELEMDESLEDVMAKLAEDPDYVDQFRRAFESGAISEDHIARALEQFLFTMVSNQSRYDQWLLGEVSAPYMHDGRFVDIDEVIDHYDHGVVSSSTLDPMMQYNVDYGLGLTDQDRADLIAFLHTLTDVAFLENPAFSNPH